MEFLLQILLEFSLQIVMGILELILRAVLRDSPTARFLLGLAFVLTLLWVAVKIYLKYWN